MSFATSSKRQAVNYVEADLRTSKPKVTKAMNRSRWEFREIRRAQYSEIKSFARGRQQPARNAVVDRMRATSQACIQVSSSVSRNSRCLASACSSTNKHFVI